MGADVGGAFAQAGGLFDVFDALQFAFEAGEGVEGAGVVIAALFEKLFAEVEGHSAYASGGVGGERGEEHAGTIFESGAGALDCAGGGLLGLQHKVYVADEFVDALGA